MGGRELPLILIRSAPNYDHDKTFRLLCSRTASKWFYFSILATILSYLALDQGIVSYARDYLQFGSSIASLSDPSLRFFFLICRYSIVLTEIGILSWAWYAPVEVSMQAFPDTLPAGTQWDQIYLRFLNEENVFIMARQFKRQASYIEMGFADKRGKKPSPNAQWDFLKLLAKKNGVIAYDDRDMDFSYKKKKQLLSQALKQYFHLGDDPFYPYENENAYRIRMTLSPSPEPKKIEKKPDFMDFAEDLREAYEEQIGIR